MITKYKEYKERMPEETIQNIRTILFNIGLLLKEEHREFNRVPSCRTTISNNRLAKLGIGTNGKGRDFSYAMASGYAEFMERIQNRILFTREFLPYASDEYTNNLNQNSLYLRKLKEIDFSKQFRFDPKEQIWSLDKVLKLWGEELKMLYNIDEDEELKAFCSQSLSIDEVAMVPCYAVNEKKEVLIPMELMLYAVGSNGMCAGNSDIEAVLQGLCEIFERYAMYEIYHKKMTPPDISLEEFAGTPVYEKIQNIIKQTGYEIIIKDCSLGKRLPVVGVIIIDREKMVYNFKLGSDFVPYIALERCITELYQSLVGFRGVPMNFCWEKDEMGKTVSSENIEKNYEDIVATGSGFWPISIFFSEFSYNFSGFPEDMGISNELDVNLGLSLAKDEGMNIYLRNNSYLGFPTYHIIIPGMSQTIANKNRLELLSKDGIIHDLSFLMKLAEITKDEASRLIKALEHGLNVGLIDRFSYAKFYLYNTDEDLLDWDLYHLLCMLYYYIGDYGNSKLCLDEFLKDKGVDCKYYFAISDFIRLYRIDKIEESETLHVLSKLYGKSMAQEVMDDMKFPDKIFMHLSLPNCFNCENCKTNTTCGFFDILKIERRLNQAQIEAGINQFDIPLMIKLNS